MRRPFCNPQGFSQLFFDVLLGGIFFRRFRLGGVAKIDFWCFRCGFALVGNVCLSLGGAAFFALLGKSSSFFGAFLKCGKNNVFAFSNGLFLFWERLRAISLDGQSDF